MDKLNIKEAGLKVTQPRIRILKILETSEQKHFSAEELFHILSRERSPQDKKYNWISHYLPCAHSV